MKKLAVLGGGTGTFVVLQGLKNCPVALSAIVSMADGGGSTGTLRDELGVLPPGDVRKCLVALSHSSTTVRSLMEYRFDEGGLAGHSLGNLLLSALEKITGSFEKAIEEIGKILYIKGQVIPVTTHCTHLKMLLKNQTILHSEKEIYLSQEIEHGYESIYLSPSAKANCAALQAISEADLIVIGPGGLYTSLIPNFLVEGISHAIEQSKAKKVFVMNLMNRKGQTTNFCASTYLQVLHSYINTDLFDYILVNNQAPPDALLKKYSDEGTLVPNDLDGPHIISGSFLGALAIAHPHDLLQRSLIRHDSNKLAKELLKIVDYI